MKGILGQKAGMTQIITDSGISIPVTVINIKGNVVTQVKSIEKNGYNAIQLAMGEKKINRTTKPLQGHYNNAKTSPKKFSREIRNMSGFDLGHKLMGKEVFKEGDFVDVSGISKGKGFAGVIKRYSNSIGPKSHGSQFHRQIGSMSDIEGNKISKGKKMPGQTGSKNSTSQNLEIISINDDKNYLLVKGAIPGPNKSYVVVKSSIKLKPSKDPVVLANQEEIERKNKLIAKANDLGIKTTNDMTNEALSKAIEEAEANKNETSNPKNKQESSEQLNEDKSI